MADPLKSDDIAEMDAFENHPLAPLNITKKPPSVRKPVAPTANSATEQSTAIHEAMGSLSLSPTNQTTSYQAYQPAPNQEVHNPQIYGSVPTTLPPQSHAEYPQTYLPEGRHSISAGSTPSLATSSPVPLAATQAGTQAQGNENVHQPGGYPQTQQAYGGPPGPPGQPAYLEQVQHQVGQPTSYQAGSLPAIQPIGNSSTHQDEQKSLASQMPAFQSNNPSAPYHPPQSPSLNYAAPTPTYYPYQPTQSPPPAQSPRNSVSYQPPMPLAGSPISNQQSPKPPPPSGAPPGHQQRQSLPPQPTGTPPNFQQNPVLYQQPVPLAASPVNYQQSPPPFPSGAPPGHEQNQSPYQPPVPLAGSPISNQQSPKPPPPSGAPPGHQQRQSLPPQPRGTPPNFQQTQYAQPTPISTPPNFQQPHNPPIVPATPQSYQQNPIPQSGTPSNFQQVQNTPPQPTGTPSNLQQIQNIPPQPTGTPSNFQQVQNIPPQPTETPSNFQQVQNTPPLPMGTPLNYQQPQSGPNLPPGAPPNPVQQGYHSPQPSVGIPSTYQQQQGPQIPQSPPVTPIPYQYPQNQAPLAGGPPGHHASRSQSLPASSPYQYQHVQSAPLQHGNVASPIDYFGTPLQHSQTLGGAQNSCPAFCSSCKIGIPYEVQYSECGICAVWLCHNCVSQHTAAHQHSMTKFISRQTLASAYRDPRTCAMCRKSIHVRLECRICQFSLCTDCNDSAEGPRHIHNDYTKIEPPGLSILLQNVATECRECVYRPTLGHCDRCLIAVPSNDVVMECATCDLNFDRSIGLCRKCHSETAHIHDPNHRWVSLGSQICTDELQKPGIFACRECNWRSSDFKATIAPTMHPHTSLFLFMGPSVLQIMLPVIYKNCPRKPMRIDSPSPMNTKVGTGSHWSCDFCRNKFLMPVGYVCTTCPDFCLCNYCYPTASHLHKHGQGAFAYQPPPKPSAASGPGASRQPGQAAGAGRGRGQSQQRRGTGPQPLKVGVRSVDKHLEKWDKNGKLNTGLKTSSTLMKQTGTAFMRGFLGTGRTVHHHHHHTTNNNNNQNNAAANQPMLFTTGGDSGGGDSGMAGDSGMGGDSGLAGDSGLSALAADSGGDSGGGDSGGIWSTLAAVASSPVAFGGDSGGDSGGGDGGGGDS